MVRSASAAASRLGFVAQEVAANDDSLLDVVLQADDERATR